MEAEELEKRDKMNDNIKIDFYGIDCKGVTWIEITVEGSLLFSKPINLRVPRKEYLEELNTSIQVARSVEYPRERQGKYISLIREHD
jgi:hypothetical protein